MSVVSDRYLPAGSGAGDSDLQFQHASGHQEGILRAYLSPLQCRRQSAASAPVEPINRQAISTSGPVRKSLATSSSLQGSACTNAVLKKPLRATAVRPAASYQSKVEPPSAHQTPSSSSLTANGKEGDNDDGDRKSVIQIEHHVAPFDSLKCSLCPDFSGCYSQNELRIHRKLKHEDIQEFVDIFECPKCRRGVIQEVHHFRKHMTVCRRAPESSEKGASSSKQTSVRGGSPPGPSIEGDTMGETVVSSNKVGELDTVQSCRRGKASRSLQQQQPREELMIPAADVSPSSRSPNGNTTAAAAVVATERKKRARSSRDDHTRVAPAQQHLCQKRRRKDGSVRSGDDDEEVLFPGLSADPYDPLEWFLTEIWCNMHSEELNELRTDMELEREEQGERKSRTHVRAAR
eukprot:GHVU01211465.1.p1 GENE.GHVU01211465.1~~GHVU01211465.1.p1  ORF type:complete len:405 (+),score=51.22 GHVU01211465.1:98-1312(+)